MSKSKTKKNNSYNVTAVNALEKKFDISKQYIRQCLRGDRTSKTADKIRTDYSLLVKEIEALVQKQ